MANKSLTDLTARTATADSDLLHINSGGTDYKETKANFLQGAIHTSFGTSSTLISQIDALPVGTYVGTISSNGHQTETGVPKNSSFYVNCYKYSASSVICYITSFTGISELYFKKCYGGTWDSDWTLVPTRNEITSLNNSLTNSFVTVISASAAVTVTRNNSYRYGNVLFVGVRFNVSSAISIYGYVLQIPSTLRCPTDVYAPLMSSYFTTMDGRGLYLDAASYTFRASSAIPSGDYTFYCPILVN